jgi:mannose/fructose-specific phosphotransferase system component IIA
MKRGILITHGPIGAAIIEAVRSIIGTDEGLYALSVNEFSMTDLARELERLIAACDDCDGVIVMSSLKGGSCWNVSALTSKERARIRVLSGVNLPMVLSFITKRDALSLDDLAEKMAADGKRGIDLLDRSR